MISNMNSALNSYRWIQQHACKFEDMNSMMNSSLNDSGMWTWIQNYELGSIQILRYEFKVEYMFEVMGVNHDS